MARPKKAKHVQIEKKYLCSVKKKKRRSEIEITDVFFFFPFIFLFLLLFHFTEQRPNDLVTTKRKSKGDFYANEKIFALNSSEKETV